MKLPDINVEQITTLEEAKNMIELLLTMYKKQQERLTRLEAENARLKGQPKKPSFSSQKQQQSSSLLFFSGKPRQWKKQSRGKLPVDHKVILPEVTYCACGQTTFTTLRTHTKIVQGMVLERRNVAYHGRDKQCIACGKIYKSILPSKLKGISFDPTLGSLISFFKYGCRMTYPLIHRMLKGFGVQISYGEINEMLLRNGDNLAGALAHLRTVGFAKSAFVQSDATGAKRREKHTGRIINQYAQIISNKALSVFFLTRYYNTKTLNMLLGVKGRQKPFVSDDGSPNGDGCRCKIKQLCWVHEVRHYKKLFPFFNSHKILQEDILSQWQRFYHLAKQYGHDPTEEKRLEVETLFDHITSQTTGYDLLDKQLLLTRKKKDRLLTFLDHPELPIHNNQCEQDLREFVIQRRISHETKSVRGDRSFARHLSVIQTAQKQGLDVFKTLHGLLTGTLTPTVLTANIC